MKAGYGIFAAVRWIAAAGVFAGGCGVLAQDAHKKVVTTDADLPRYSYPLTVPPSQFVSADGATFHAFAAKVDADVRTLLDGYEIADKATLRQLLMERAAEAMLTNDNAGALTAMDRLRTLEEKPSAIATSGLLDRQIVEARMDAGATSGAAFDAAFSKRFRSAVDALPWDISQERVKGLRQFYQVASETMLSGALKANADAAVAKTGSIDFTSAMALVNARRNLVVRLPVKSAALAVVTPYIQTHTAAKPDIWPAREVTLTASDKLTPVRIAIWDSGVDTALYSAQLYTDPAAGAHEVHGLAFDMHGGMETGDLQPLTAEQKSSYPKVLKLRQGLDDLHNGIDSPEASTARTFMSTTPPDQLAPFMENMTFLSQWMHGTHVAGIAVRGNPAARLVVARFNDGLVYLPFEPTLAWAQKFKADFAMLGDYFRTHDVRVVNMSWADSQSEFEQWLTRTSGEKDPGKRKQMAGELYAVWRDAVQGAIQHAPGTLFVCAAGNSNSDAGFLGDVPASLHLPNLVTAGAVDQAGEETSFTSYGDTVVLDANGYRVPSYVPGGTILRGSGTSMASPNVVNLAAKLIALNPKLTPEQTIDLMKQGATASTDGRLHVIDPKATVALLAQKN